MTFASIAHRGANARHKNGDITNEQRLEIFEKIRLAQIVDFKPLLYVMPFNSVSTLLKTVPVKHRANPLNDEFIIEGLPGSSFDIIDP